MAEEESKKRPRSDEEAGENTGEETSEPPVKAAKTEGVEDAEDAPTKDIASEEPSPQGGAAGGEEDLFGDDEATGSRATEATSEKTNGAPKSEESDTKVASATESKEVEAEKPVGTPAGGAAAAAPEPVQEASVPDTEATETTTPVQAPAAAPAATPVAAAPVPVAAPGITTASPVDPTAQATVVNPNSIVEERGELAPQYVGRVIGKGGEMIRDLQARSGCRIDVDQNVAPGQPRIITYRGTRKTVDFGKHLVAMLCSENSHASNELPLGAAARKHLVVPSSSIGKVIGRRGDMIRDLQTRSQAKIQVDHSGTSGIDPSSRQITITGTQEAVVKAEEMIMFLVANPMMDAMTAINMLVDDKTQNGGTWGSGPPYPNLPNQGQNMQLAQGFGGYQERQGYGAGGGYGGGYQQHSGGFGQYGGGQYGGVSATEVEIFPAAKMYMGRIIGQKGVTINDLQKRSGCDIQIDQNVAPHEDCRITLKGSRQGIESAKQMLREVIETGPNHPYAGGGPPGGGYGGQQGGYQQGGYQQGGYDQPPTQYQHQPAAQHAPVAHQPYGQQYQAPQYGQPPQPYQAQAPQQPYGGVPQQYPYAQQPQSMVAPMASPWKSATAADGQVYYYNERTGETQWEKPAGML